MLDITPLFSRLIVRPKGNPDQINGIYIPKTTKEMEATEGEVVGIGPNVTAIAVGDMIYYGRYAVHKFERNGEEYLFMNEEDVMGRIG